MVIPKRRIRQVDCVTGEVLEGNQVFFPYKPKLEEPFMMSFLRGYKELAKSGLTGEEFSVLMAYMSELSYENFLQISQSAIAKDLEMPRQHVNRATKKLVEKGILIKGEKIGKYVTFRLNPFYAWRGKPNKKYEKARKEASKIVKDTKFG